MNRMSRSARCAAAGEATYGANASTDESVKHPFRYTIDNGAARLRHPGKEAAEAFVPFSPFCPFCPFLFLKPSHGCAFRPLMHELPLLADLAVAAEAVTDLVHPSLPPPSRIPP